METICVICVMLGVFLYMDRFLFRGELAQLIIQGWRERLHLRRQQAPTDTAPPAAAPASSDLIERKKYAEGMERHTDEPSPKSEPTDAENTTFTSPTEASAPPEVLEWRDPTYFSDLPSVKPKSATPPAVAETKSPRWEDEDFADSESEEETMDADLTYETERIRREVAASLEDWRIEEARMEYEMSVEEMSDVESFDMDVYQ